VNVLLDTHVLIWWDEGRRLAAEARQAIEEAVTESGFLELPVTARHAERVTGLPPHHRDPFDRMLVAQAAVEELTLVTRDPVFARYAVALIEA
jgi:PIN domain nuclease of toxin-antitoxin system